MPLQPLGHEEVTRRKKQKALAAFYNANPTKLQQGVPPSQMDGLTYLDRRLGNTTERSISAGGVLVEDPGCACASTGGGGG